MSDHMSVIIPSVVMMIVVFIFLIVMAKEYRSIKYGNKPNKIVTMVLAVFSHAVINSIIILYSLIVFLSPNDHYDGLSIIANLALSKAVFDYGLLVMHKMVWGGGDRK